MADAKGEDAQRQKAHAARREAQPIPWEELTQQQRDAATQACTILGDLAEQELPRSDEDRSEKPPALKRFLPPIDRERHNHVVLLDGGRGTGKTALLITLLNLWNRRLLGQDVDKGVPEELRNLTKDVVPVGMIDLQPLPASTNLLLHLVGQFRPLVEVLEEQGRGSTESQRLRARAPWHDVETEEPPATRAWKTFFRAAAMGWDGSLLARSARLDPEAYALELEHTERLRLDVRRSFRELVDALVGEFPALVRWPDKRHPLFVIPVDDADMNPERVVELLDLVRTLWHPRVAFLLTGHSELFLTVLRAQSLAALRAPVRELRFLSAEDILQIAGMKPAELAGNIYDKLIPEAHRCRVPAMSPEERLGFLERSKILRLLPALKHPLALEHLEEYFAIQPQVRLILPDKPRSITDLAVRIDAGIRRLESADQESNAPSASQPWERRQGLSLEIIQGLIDVAVLGGSALDVDAEVRAGSIRVPGAAQQQRWRFRSESGAHLRAGSGTIQFLSAPEFQVYSQAPALVTQPAGSMQASYVAAFDANRVGAAPRIGLHHFIVWREVEIGARRLTLRVSWPLPDWESPLDYAAFFAFWRHVAGLIQGSLMGLSFASRVGELARLYLNAVMGFIEFRRMRGLETSPSSLQDLLRPYASRVKSEDATWSSLAAKVRALADEPPSIATTPAIEWARRRAGLLAAPESGLEVEAANEWLKELVSAFGSRWEETRTWLHGEQRHRIAIAAGAQNITERDADLLIDELDDSASAYAWREEVRLQGQAVGAEIVQLAERVGAVPPALSDRLNLSAYLAAGRMERIVDAAPLDLLRRWRDRIAEWADTQGTAQRLVIALWDDAASMGRVPRIDAITGKADLKALRAFYDTLNHPWEWHAEQPVVDVGPTLRISHVECVWREDLWVDQPLAKPLFELVWDVLHDANDSTTTSAYGNVCWWDGVGGKRDTPKARLALYPWPFVPWQSFMDNQRFALSWAQVRGTAARASQLAPDDASVAIDLAMWYVTFINDVIMHRAYRERSWQSGIDPRDLAQRIVGYGRPEYQRAHPGERWAAFATWCRALPVLAAPESGLTRGAAETILDELKPTDEQAAELRKLRRDRMMYRKPPRQHVEPWLRAIDDEDPSHPWVTLIERRK